MQQPAGAAADHLGRSAVAHGGDGGQHGGARLDAVIDDHHLPPADIGLGQDRPELPAALLELGEGPPGRPDHLPAGEVVPAGGRLDHRDPPVLVDGADDLLGQPRGRELGDQQDVERAVDRLRDRRRDRYAAVGNAQDQRVVALEKGQIVGQLGRRGQAILEEPHGVVSCRAPSATGGAGRPGYRWGGRPQSESHS